MDSKSSFVCMDLLLTSMGEKKEEHSLLLKSKEGGLELPENFVLISWSLEQRHLTPASSQKCKMDNWGQGPLRSTAERKG